MLIYAEWVILIASLDDTFGRDELLSLYRSRWQIELLFKRIKQHLKINTIREATPKYAQAIIKIWLLIWAISERKLIEYQKALLSRRIDPQRVSLWVLSQLSFMKIVSIIECQWALLIDANNIALLSKFLLNHKSSSANQSAHFLTT